MISMHNPHIIFLSLAVLIAAVAALIHAVKIAHRPTMTDQQWRCYMDSLNPYADKSKPHSCRRCSPGQNNVGGES